MVSGNALQCGGTSVSQIKRLCAERLYEKRLAAYNPLYHSPKPVHRFHQSGAPEMTNVCDSANAE
jgi:hypothetical protein